MCRRMTGKLFNIQKFSIKRFTAWWEHDEKNNKVSIHAHQSQDERRKQIITDVDVLRTAGPFALCKIGLV